MPTTGMTAPEIWADSVVSFFRFHQLGVHGSLVVERLDLFHFCLLPNCAGLNLLSMPRSIAATPAIGIDGKLAAIQAPYEMLNVHLPAFSAQGGFTRLPKLDGKACSQDNDQIRSNSGS